MRGFLNSDLDAFVRGQYKGDSLEDVVMDDPDYVKFLLRSPDHELTEEEEDAMRQALMLYEEE